MGGGRAQLPVVQVTAGGNALDAGGSESMYDDIEHFESSELLSDAHKAALRYADALIWSPARISGGGFRCAGGTLLA